MKISYGITVKDEIVEIQHLLTFLLKNKRQQDEIVILFDNINGSPLVEEYLRANSINDDCGFKWYPYPFNGHFADLKNYLTSWCTGDYIFQIDADELPNETLIEMLPDLLSRNTNCEVFLVPRVNTVDGLTQEHIQKWGWSVNESGWVNWPDYQWRIYKNSTDIKWVNKVHEKLHGFKTWSLIPEMEKLALYHPKTIDRQEKQNSYYDTI
jgi:hypothetical protein